MLDWSPGLELGVLVLDTHHRRLVELANVVFAGLRAGAPRPEILTSLRQLADFAAWHFRFEEVLMQETAYADRTRHDEQHGELLGQMERFIGRIASGSATLLQSARTINFLGAWVTHHIQHTDRPLADHLIRHGWDPLPDNQI